MIRRILEVIVMEAGGQASCNCTGWLPQTVDRHNSDYVTTFHPNGWIILPCSTFTLKAKDVVCCNCDFFSGPIVLQIEQKSDPAKSASGLIFGIGYPNPVTGRKSVSVNP